MTLDDTLVKTEGVAADVAAGKSTATVTHDDRETVVFGVVAAAPTPVIAVGGSN